MFNFGFLKTEVPSEKPENQRDIVARILALLKKVIR